VRFLILGIIASLLYQAYLHFGWDDFVWLYFLCAVFLPFSIGMIEHSLKEEGLRYTLTRIILGLSIMASIWFFVVFIIGLF
jgi:hypothetical protein